MEECKRPCVMAQQRHSLHSVSKFWRIHASAAVFSVWSAISNVVDGGGFTHFLSSMSPHGSPARIEHLNKWGYKMDRLARGILPRYSDYHRCLFDSMQDRTLAPSHCFLLPRTRLIVAPSIYLSTHLFRSDSYVFFPIESSIRLLPS